MSFYIISATINGEGLEAGDEIGVFDGNVCVGSAILLDQIGIPNNMLSIIASSNYFKGKEQLDNLNRESFFDFNLETLISPSFKDFIKGINGFTPGNSISFRFWDSSEVIEISMVISAYINNYGEQIDPPVFENQSTVFVCLLIGTPILGCLNADACNYNPDANIFEASCLYDDCLGECGGSAMVDECGVCGGNGIDEDSCDCDGNVEDECGVCGGNGIDEDACDCDGNVLDCTGVCNGGLEFDCCGICGGDNSQCSPCCGGSFYEDCTDDCYIDVNGECCYLFHLDTNQECCIDLEFDANGECCYEFDLDCCGICGGDGSTCGTYMGDMNSDGTWNVLDIIGLANCVVTNSCGEFSCCTASCDVIGDLNNDGVNDVLDIIILANCILANDCIFGSG